MKKILTLMVMFAMTAGILSTQAQTLSYQVVVRDVNNNLVVNQKLTVSVEIYSPINSPESALQEDITATTNLNGMLSLTLNKAREEQEQTPWEEYVIDWTNAKIVLNFNNDNINNVVDTVYAVPYALQSYFLLTTEQIVNYIGSMGNVSFDIISDVPTNYQSSDNVTADNSYNEDWVRFYTALRGNKSFFNALRDTVVNYVKANYPIARDIAFHYLSQMNAQDVKQAYDTFALALENNKQLDSTLHAVIMDYVQNHRDMAFDLAKYYAEHATPNGVTKLYNAVMANQEVVDPIMDSILIVYLKEFGLDPACLTDYNYTFCQVLNDAAHLGNMGTCIDFSGIKNSVDDGLIALYNNRGVIYTAYIKNYDPTIVYSFGFQQSEDPFVPGSNNNVEILNAEYQPITENFGKFEYKLSNTSTCGKTFYVRAFANFIDTCEGKDAHDTLLVSDDMTVVVPDFEISITQDGNTLKATFDKPEATDAFNIKKDNIVWKDDNGVVLGKGLTYEIPVDTQIAYPITATAHLGQCEHYATYPSNQQGN